MKQFLLNIINTIASPLIGKGYIDKYFPFFISIYEFFYYVLQPSGLKDVTLPLGLRMKVPYKDTHVGMYLISKGEFEPLETTEILKFLGEKSIVFDIGANFGYYSLLFSRKASRGTIYSFEPDKDNIYLLRENISFNALTNIHTEEMALSDTTGSAHFKSSKIHRGKSQISLENRFSYEVPITTLDSYCLNKKISEIDLIKLDVEGSEIPILKGGKNILSKSKNLTLFIEYNPRSYTEFGFTKKDFFETLSLVGLIPTTILDESSKKTLPFSDEVLEEILKKSTYTNIICKKV